MKPQIIFIVACVVVCKLCEGKVFTRCQLARELTKTKMIQRSFLGNWVCLIEKSSNRDTSALTVTPGGKKFYGLYQIPHQYCKEGKRGGKCDIKCEDLLNEDIRDDTECAQKIYYQEGFKFWPMWVARCKNDDFITKEVHKCPEFQNRDSPASTPPLSNLDRLDKRSTNLCSTLKRSILGLLQCN